MILLEPQRRFAEKHAYMFPELADQMTQILHRGALAEYDCGTPTNPRTRGQPYSVNGEANSRHILSKLRKGVYNRRMFMCAAEAISESEYIETTPTTTAEKKNPYRPISADRGIIAEMRRINMRFDSTQYYPIVAPRIQEIARRAMRLKGLFPELPLYDTMRDIASAFRLLRLHPSMTLRMVTEFPASRFEMDHDLICFYLVMPFGRYGSASHFALFGDAITLAHHQHGIPRSGRLGHAFTSRMHADDGISIEIATPKRSAHTIECWERPARGIIGTSAINEDKLQVEGQWQPVQIILGFVVDLKELTITLPHHQVANARVFIDELLAKNGSHFLTIIELLQLRGNLEHFSTTNGVWRLIKNATGKLLGHPDEQGSYVRCPNPTMWGFFWQSVDIVGVRRSREKAWGDLPQGDLDLLLCAAERLSFPSERGKSVRISVDAALHWMGGISWKDQEMFRLPTTVIQQLVRGAAYEVIISESELAVTTIWGYGLGDKTRIPSNRLGLRR